MEEVVMVAEEMEVAAVGVETVVEAMVQAEMVEEETAEGGKGVAVMVSDTLVEHMEEDSLVARAAVAWVMVEVAVRVLERVVAVRVVAEMGLAVTEGPREAGTVVAVMVVVATEVVGMEEGALGSVVMVVVAMEAEAMAVVGRAVEEREKVMVAVLAVQWGEVKGEGVTAAGLVEEREERMEAARVVEVMGVAEKAVAGKAVADKVGAMLAVVRVAAVRVAAVRVGWPSHAVPRAPPRRRDQRRPPRRAE